MKKYSIGDIARMCGTSKATVSRVINKPEIVSEELRNKVLQKIKEIGYVPDPFARNLSKKKLYGFSLFVLDILNPFFALLVREISDILIKKSIPLLVCDIENDIEKEKLYLDFVINNKTSGVIFTEGISPSIVRKASKHIPVVLIDQHYQPGTVPEVTSDNYWGAYDAVNYLIKLNHRKIGFVSGPENWPSIQQRYNGYKGALKHNGIQFEEKLVYKGKLSVETGIKAMEYYLEKSIFPTAIFCSNDQIAIGVLNKARDMNISIPNDLSIIGFDGIPFVSIIKPKITTVKQNVKLIAETAVRLLMDQINKKSSENVRVRVPTQFIIGESCNKVKIPIKKII